MKELKTFIWNTDGTLQDYSNGMVCVVAYDFEEAVKLIEKECNYAVKNMNIADYKIIEKPQAFLCWGEG